VSIHSFVEWLDTFSYVLRPTDVTVKQVNHIRCFAIDIAKYVILLSLRQKTLLPVSQRFVSPGHSLDAFGRSKIYIIDHNPSWKENQRQKRESLWTRKLRTLHPEPTDVTVKQVNHIRCFAIDIAKYFILLSCRLTMERLCVLQLETSLATLVTTWFTTIQVGKRIKDKKERVFGPASYEHYIRRA
jgi:hypothetical protein